MPGRIQSNEARYTVRKTLSLGGYALIIMFVLGLFSDHLRSFTDHVFGLMHLLGFRFAPRIRDLADKCLYIHGDEKNTRRWPI